MEKYIDAIGNWLTTEGLKIVIAVIILFVSFRLVHLVTKKLGVVLEKNRRLDQTLTHTLVYLSGIALKILICVALIGYLGIDTSGITAVLASFGVCVGLAVNGALSNLAGGALLLITRPFKMGDYISAQGYEGTVEEIHITNTKLLTVDNKVVYLPNGTLSAGNIVNYSEKQNRRIDQTYTVTGNDPEKVEAILRSVCERNPKILKDPAIFVRTTDYGGDKGTRVTLKVWCRNDDFWDIYYDLSDSVRTAFDENGIDIPFDRMDVHLTKD